MQGDIPAPSARPARLVAAFALSFLLIASADARAQSTGRTGGAPPARDAAARQQAPPARQAAGFRKGQKVQAKWGTRWLPATVLEVARDGRVRVRYDEDGVVWTLGPEDVRAVGVATGTQEGAKAEPPAPGARPVPAGPRTEPGLSTFKRGQRVEVQVAGKWVPATVLGVEGDFVEVRYDDSGLAHRVFPRTMRPLPANAIGIIPAAPRELVPDADPKWSYKPSPAPSVTDPAKPPEPLEIPAVLFDEAKTPGEALVRRARVDTIVPAAAAPKMVFVYKKEQVLAALRTRILTVDYAARKVAGPFELRDNVEVVSLSPTGGRLVVRPFERSMMGTRGRIDVYDLTGQTPAVVASLEPYKGAAQFGNDVLSAALVDDERVLTSNGSGRVMLWELPRGAAPRPVYAVNMGTFMGLPRLDATRTAFAVPSAAGITMLDVDDGRTLGFLPLQGTSLIGVDLAFRGDGRRLATLDGRRLRVWDLETGKAVSDVLLQYDAPGSAVRWWGAGPGAELVSIGGDDNVVDPTKGVIAWAYTLMGEKATRHSAGWTAAVGQPGVRGEPAMLRFSELPHAEAVRRATSMSAEEALAVRPGARVTVEVNAEGLDDVRPAAEAWAREQLRQQGVSVADAQPVKLVLTLTSGQTIEVGNVAAGGGTKMSGDVIQARWFVNDRIAWQELGHFSKPARGGARGAADGAPPFSAIRIPGKVPVPMALLPVPRTVVQDGKFLEQKAKPAAPASVPAAPF